MGSRGARRGPSRTPRAPAVGVAILLLSAACATAPERPPPSPPDLIALLPDGEGRTGAIAVSAAGALRLLAEPGQAVTVAAGAPPGEPFAMPAEEVRAQFGAALAALPASPLQFILYFVTDTAELTQASRAQVKGVVRAIRDQGAVSVGIVGHTDTVGPEEFNDRLSLRRARAVADLLAAEGVDASLFDIASHGENNPLVPTGDEVAEPRNRRVEVTVR